MSKKERKKCSVAAASLNVVNSIITEIIIKKGKKIKSVRGKRKTDRDKKAKEKKKEKEKKEWTLLARNMRYPRTCINAWPSPRCARIPSAADPAGRQGLHDQP